jgi:hypothetical protein
MASFTYYAPDLANGITNEFEILAGAPPTPIDVNASLSYNHMYNATVSWSTIRDAASSPSNTPSFTAGVEAFSGRGATTFLVSRSNLFFNLSVFTSTISNLTLRFNVNYGNFGNSSNIRVFDGGLTTISGTGTEYPLYLNQGAIAFSDPVLISGLGVYEIPLNNTAITAFNSPSKSRAICVVAENDYNNSEPAVGYAFQFGVDIINNPVKMVVS